METQPGSMAVSRAAGPDKLDTLKIYGFSFDFPAEAKLEFNPKFSRSSGDLAVKLPNAFVFLTWGPLDKLPDKVRRVEDHANYSEDKLRSSTRGKATNVERRMMRVNGHGGIFNRVKAEIQARKIMRGGIREEEARSLHLHCEDSNRYFVVYGALNEQNYDRQAQTLEEIIGSLRCH